MSLAVSSTADPPRLPDIASEGEAGKKEQAERDRIGQAERERDIVNKQERYGDRHEAERDEEEYPDGGKNIISPKTRLEKAERWLGQTRRFGG